MKVPRNTAGQQTTPTSRNAMSQHNQMLLSIVIPAYNEEQNIVSSVPNLKKTLAENGVPHELILVNDDSTDKTGDVIDAMAAEDSCVRSVHKGAPRGFGRAIRAGLDKVEGDVVVIYMADASDSPEDVVRYYREIESGYDCVFGSRFIKGAKTENYPLVKLVSNRIVNRCMQLLFWTRFNDLTNSFKAYRSYVLKECGPYRASHFNITIELSLNAVIRNYNINQVPISWQGRTWGSSNLRLTEMGRRYLSTLIKIFCEKWLILDDLVAESVAARTARSSSLFSLESRVERLEETLERMEQTRK